MLELGSDVTPELVHSSAKVGKARTKTGFVLILSEIKPSRYHKQYNIILVFYVGWL